MRGRGAGGGSILKTKDQKKQRAKKIKIHSRSSDKSSKITYEQFLIREGVFL